MRTIWLGCFLASSVVPALAQSSLYGILLGQPISTQLQACPKESRAVKTACWTRDEWPDVTDLPNMLETPQCIARGQQLISRPESYYRIHLPQKAMPGVTKLMVLERDGSVQVIIARVTADHDVEHDFLMRFGKPSTQRRPRLEVTAWIKSPASTRTSACGVRNGKMRLTSSSTSMESGVGSS